MIPANQIAKEIRRSRDENSLLHLVPHAKVIQDFDAWGLSLIAFALDEALVQLSELGIRVGIVHNGL
eukprot:11132947-Karenia_brevis.AAC.1